MQPASPPRQVSSPFANAPPFSSFDSQEVSAVEGDHDAGWSFHEVPLNDKPAQMADSVDQNGEHAQQQAAAESRKANPAMPPDDQVSQQAADLLKENALLHRRLQHVEGEAADILGEMEELRERLAGEQQLRSQAQHDLAALRAELSALTLQAEGQETRLEQQLAEAREAVLQAQSDGQAAVQALQQQLEASQQQLAALPGPARPSEAGSVADDASSMPAGDGQDEATELKGRITKAKRQLLSLKTKLGEATAARDAALAEVANLQAQLQDSQSSATDTAAEQGVQKQLAQATEQVGAMASQLRTAQAEHAQQIEHLQQQLAELQAYKLASERDLAHAASQQGTSVRALEEALQAKETRLQAAEAHSQQLQQELEAQTAELTAASDSIARLAQRLQEQELLGSPAPSHVSRGDLAEAAEHVRTSQAASTAGWRGLQLDLSQVAANGGAVNPLFSPGEPSSPTAAGQKPKEMVHAADSNGTAVHSNGDLGSPSSPAHEQADAQQARSPNKEHEAHRPSTADSPAASLSTPRSGRAPLPRPPRTTTGASSFEDWETQLERLQLQLQELSSEKAALQSEHQAGQSKLHSLLSQRDQLQQCLQEAETGQRGVQAKRAAQLGREGDALRQQLGQLQDQREALSRQLADAQQALSQLEDLHAGSLQAISQEHEALQQAHSYAQAQCASLQRELATAHASATRAVSASETQIASLTAELSALQQQLAAAEAQHAAELQQSQRAPDQADPEVGEATHAHELQAQLADSDAQLQQLTVQHEQLSRQLAELTTAGAGQEERAAAAEAEVKQLRGQLRELTRSMEEHAGSREGLQAMLSQHLEEAEHLKDALKQRTAELAAVREGSKAEASLTAQSLAATRERAAAAEAQADALRTVAVDIEADLIAAREEAQQRMSAADARCKAAEARITDAQAQVEAQEQQLQTLQETLQAERAAAAAEAASAEAQHEHLLADARAELAGAGQRDRETLEQTLLSQLADKAKEVEGVQREAQRLQGELSGMAQAVQEAQELVQRNEQLERETAAAVAGVGEARRELALAQTDLAAQKQAAAERQKRFTVLSSTFKRKEEGFASQLAAARREAAAARADMLAAQRTVEAAWQEVQEAQQQEAQSRAEHDGLQAARSRAEAHAEAASQEALEAAGRASAAEALLQAERAAMATERACLGPTAEEVDSRVAAVVAEREEAAGRRVAGAEAAAVAAAESARLADGRAAAAEAAKIELSLQLAQMASTLSQDHAARHDEQPRQEGTGEEAGGRRLEEAELAAKVGSRRAAAAEAEVERLQRMLAEAEKRSESLAWQVKMVSDPRQVGGRAVQGAPAKSMLDMFGCGANFRR